LDPEKKTPVNIVNSVARSRLTAAFEAKHTATATGHLIASVCGKQVRWSKRSISHPTMLLQGLILFEQTSQQGVAALNLRSLANSQIITDYK